MPQASNITVNNNAAVAKVFTLISPAMDGTIAAWDLKEGLNRAAFPKLTVKAFPSGDNARKATIKLAMPQVYTESTTGLTRVGKVAYLEVSVKIPDEFPEAMKLDFAAYAKNLIANPLMNEIIRDATSAS